MQGQRLDCRQERGCCQHAAYRRDIVGVALVRQHSLVVAGGHLKQADVGVSGSSQQALVCSDLKLVDLHRRELPEDMLMHYTFSSVVGRELMSS